MLTDLVVENLGVIECASLTLERGCTALTGETGAGKTLVVSALTLLAGGRADPASVRPGAREARIEGRFLVPPGHPAADTLVDMGILEPGGADASSPEGGVEVVVARTVSASASASRARINGRLVTVASLAEVGGLLLDLVGQHEHQRLFALSFQRRCLDTFSGDEAVRLAEEVAEATRRLAGYEKALEELRAQEQQRIRELDVLRYEIAELEAAQIQEGERERLLAEAGRLEIAEATGAALTRAIEALSSEGGAEDQVAAASASLDKAAGADPAFSPLQERTSAVLHEIGDISLQLRSRSADPDPEALEGIQERLSVINRLLRKYGRDEREVLRYLEEARSRAAELSRDPEHQADLQRLLDRELADARAKAAHLSKLRGAAAPRLRQAVEQVLSELALGGARVEVRLQDCPLNSGGTETVEFLIDLNATGQSRPLKRVVSGGELSRIALALHLVATHSSADTMVFDEVDAGVGGEAARALGSCLARLSKSSGSQVLVVTHLPQVAAYADAHYRVSKEPRKGRAAATVVRIDGEMRVAEVSRMLAGLPKSDRANEHARELLELAVEAS